MDDLLIMRGYRFLLTLPFIFFLFFSCETTRISESGADPEQKYLGEWASIPENVLRDILQAAPESLSRARELLRDLPGSVQVDSAVYTVDYLFYMLYPEMSTFVSGGPTPFPAIQRTVFPLLVDSIKRGTLPDIPNQQVDIVSMMLSTLVLFTAQESTVSDQALEILAGFEKLAPYSLLPPLLRAVTSEKAGNMESAIADYEETIRRGPTCYPAVIGKARLLSIKKAYPDIPDLLNGITVPPGRNYELPRLLAIAYFHMGNYAESEKYLIASLEINPSQAELLFIQAEIAAGRGDWAFAAGTLDRGEKLQPLQESKFFLKSVVISNFPARILEAVSLLERSKELADKDPDAMELYGRLLIEAGNRIKGKQVLSEVVSTAPERTDLSLMLFHEYMKDDEWNAALRYTPEVIYTDVSDELRKEVYTVYRMNDRKEQALQVLSLLFRKNQGQEKILMEYSRLLYELKKNDEFLEILERSLGGSISGDSKSELYYLRSTLRTVPEKKMADLRSALMEDPFNSKALIGISRLHREAKEYRRAYQFMREAVLLNQKDERLQRELEELRRLAGL